MPSAHKRARRLPSGERKELIARAAAKQFADRGFHGVSLKELSRAAGVSEALLLKYFPTKEALLAAALQSCRDTSIVATIQRIVPEEPSAEALVRAIRELADSMVMIGKGRDRQDRDTLNRMLLRSLCEDGRFAALMLEEMSSRLIPFVAACLKRAKKDGDLEDTAPRSPLAASWLRHHLSMAVMAFQLPATPPVDYGAGREAFLDAFVRFSLLGLGLKSSVIARCLKKG